MAHMALPVTATCGPSDDSRNDDPVRFHGISALLVTSVWIPVPTVSLVGE